MDAAIFALSFVLLQDPSPAPTKPDEPRWTVHGVFSTDFNAELAQEDGPRNTMIDEGIVGEYVVGATGHLERGLTVTIRACYGCHDLQLQDAFVDIDLNEAFTLRAGRMAAPFGAFSQRWSPGHRESSSKPLPYIMGRMPRAENFNYGIIPAPVVDNGLSLTGRGWLGPVQATFEAAAVKGLQGGSIEPGYDSSRSMQDNNGEPAVSGRLTLASGPVTIGGSGMWGHYDDIHELAYKMAGADVMIQLAGARLTGEVLWRRTQFLDAALERHNSRRVGYAVQLDAPVVTDLRAFVLVDGLDVHNLYLTTAGPKPAEIPGVSTDDANTIRRGVGGLVWNPKAGLQVKTSAEFWNFSDYNNTWVFHFELVVEY